ncbi:hypothetical protein WKK05_36460 (plasmid) [Nostoc sp. UHCC 0302]|uniref:hypothetical protein n=1 Tax=Nostoc sp. UHCC 0302 TaxID=3134896 RepID=UPI00311C8A88
MWNGLYLRGVIPIPGGKELDLRWRNASARADCISRLQESDKLEEAAHTVLKHLGEVKRLYLTAFEEKLLNLIEFEYGNIDEIVLNSQSTKD